MFKVFKDDFIWNLVNNTLFMVITMILLVMYGFQVYQVKTDIENQNQLIQKIQINQQKASEELAKVRNMQAVYFLQLSYTLNDMNNQVGNIKSTVGLIAIETVKEKITLNKMQHQLKRLRDGYGKDKT